MLLVVAGLFTRSMGKAQHLASGLTRLMCQFDDRPKYHRLSRNRRGRLFFKQLLERVRALPGVESASLAFSVPMGLLQLNLHGSDR